MTLTPLKDSSMTVRYSEDLFVKTAPPSLQASERFMIFCTFSFTVLSRIYYGNHVHVLVTVVSLGKVKGWGLRLMQQRYSREHGGSFL